MTARGRFQMISKGEETMKINEQAIRRPTSATNILLEKEGNNAHQ